MLIVPYVCAEFRDRSGTVIHRITPDMRGVMQEAPDAIRQDLLFGLLVADGSIRTPETESRKKALEQDPLVGVTPEGRSAVIAGGPSDEPAEQEPGPAAKPGKTAKAAGTGTGKKP